MGAPNINTITSNPLITVLAGNLNTSVLSETVNGFLLSGSLTTDSGIGDNEGLPGANITGTTAAASNDGQYNNLPVSTSGLGVGMFVNVTISGGFISLMSIATNGSGGKGYQVGDIVTVLQTTQTENSWTLNTPGDYNSGALTAADLTGGGTPYMLNFNPSPIETDSNVDTVVQNQKLLIGGPQLALYHAYNTTVSSSLYNTNLLQTSNNNLGAGTLLWTTRGSDPSNVNNYMTWEPDGSDANSYQDTNIPFLIERGDIIRVEGIKNTVDTATNSSASVNVIEDFTVEEIVPHYYSSSFTNEPEFNALEITIGSYVPLNPSENLGFSIRSIPSAGNGQNSENAPTNMVMFMENIGRVNDVTIFDQGSGYASGQLYSQTATSGNGTGAVVEVISITGGAAGIPTSVKMQDNSVGKGKGFAISDTISFDIGSAGTLKIVVSDLLDFQSGNTTSGNGTGARVEVQSLTTYIAPGAGTYTPGWDKIILSGGQGYKAGDQLTISGETFLTPNQWNGRANVNTTSNSNGQFVITLTQQMLINTNFNNDFTIGVDTNAQYSYDSTTTPPNTNVPSGSVAGYHLYEKGEVAFTADTFIRVSPNPQTTLNGLLNGEVTKFTVRRQIEADDKVMLKNIIPPFGSLGVDTPSGQGFLIPNDFSKVQKSNALNIINQLKAKNAFDKPIEPGITRS